MEVLNEDNRVKLLGLCENCPYPHDKFLVNDWQIIYYAKESFVFTLGLFLALSQCWQTSFIYTYYIEAFQGYIDIDEILYRLNSICENQSQKNVMEHLIHTCMKIEQNEKTKNEIGK